jgi:Protein of unknown function (DUF2510)/DNA methylase
VTGDSPPAPPGWYQDPDEPGVLRYWDGSEWSSSPPTVPPPTVQVNTPVMKDRPPSELSRRLGDQPGVFWGAVAACVAMGVGAVGTWATALGFISIAGTSGEDGQVVLGAAVVGLLALWVRTRRDAVWPALVALLCGAVGGGISGVDLHKLSGIGTSDFFGQQVRFRAGTVTGAADTLRPVPDGSTTQRLTDEQVDALVGRIKAGEYLDEYLRPLLFRQAKEYELEYAAKTPKSRVLADTMAVPLQRLKQFGAAEGDWTNKLIFGDNLQVLKTLMEMKGRGELRNADGSEGIRLCYIDPPFATKREFRGSGNQRAYRDKIEGAAFVEFLRRRLIFIAELLAEDGTLYLHLDTSSAPLGWWWV